MSKQNELEIYKRNIKDGISRLINVNQFKEAQELIFEYEKIIKNDIEISHAKSIIFILQEKFELAEEILREAIHLDNSDSDTYYNLGHLFYLKSKFEESYKYYELAKQYSSDNTFKENVDNILKEILDKHQNRINLIDIRSMKKVLIIAHIFPPIGGSGVQRTLKFVKYLRSFGWEPIIVTAGKSHYPLIDETLISEIPYNTNVIRIDEEYTIDSKIMGEIHSIFEKMVSDKELFESYRKISLSNIEALKIPDSYILWANKVIKEIKQNIDVSEIDLIYTTSGPYSDHIIGYYLKDEYQKPWVADFRDEWSNNPYSNLDTNNWLYKINYALEQKIVHTADKVIAVTPRSAENYQKIFNLGKEKVTTITNGFDEDDFNEIIIPQNNNEKFTIIHNGLLYGIRTPITFLKALRNLINKNMIDENKVKIYFSWTENDSIWINLVNQLELNNLVEFFGYVSHKQSIEMATNADLLLLIVGSGEKNKSMYPGKLFEYLRLQRPILSLSPLNGEVDDLIKLTNRGHNVDFDDTDGIEKAMLIEYNKWLENNTVKYEMNYEVQRFERRNLTNQLVEIFNSILQVKERRI